MDDTEDDARYPPNPHRPPFRSSNPSARFLAPSIPNYVDDDDDNDPDDVSTPSDDSDDVDRLPDARDGDDSSSESRGKRRRLDKLALGFEFAPRVAPKPPAARSPADWSEGSTFALLDAWGGPFVQNGRKSLRSDEWSEVARQVSRASKIPRSDAQCRNRVDTLKKKYKKEKARIAGSVKSTSDWVYFDQMDALMSSPPPPPAEQRQPRRLPGGVDGGEYLLASSKAYVDRSNGQDEMRDSPGDSGPEDGNEEEEDDDSEGLPPVKERPSSFSLLADSIRRLGEVYEKMESNKRLQMAELERMRKEFQKDLEVQKKQILERAQAEIAKIRQEDGEEEDDEEDEEEEDSDDGGDDDEEEDGM